MLSIRTSEAGDEVRVSTRGSGCGPAKSRYKPPEGNVRMGQDFKCQASADPYPQTKRAVAKCPQNGNRAGRYTASKPPRGPEVRNTKQKVATVGFYLDRPTNQRPVQPAGQRQFGPEPRSCVRIFSVPDITQSAC